MRCCARADARRRRALAALLAAALLFGLTLPAGATFAVAAVEPSVVGRTLVVSGQLELGLTPEVEEAIATGIPIELAIEFRLYRRRALLWDERLDGWSMRRELRYHALSGQYLITGSLDGAERESANSLDEALAELGTLDQLALPLAAPLAADADYRLDVRVALDVEALPSLLRPVAYTSPQWKLNSGWTTWTVTP
jgi:hypothetical protein